MKFINQIIFVFVVFLGISPTYSQEANIKVPACQADIQKFCSTVEKGDSQIYGCLKKNLDALSTSCKKHLSKIDLLQDQRKALCKKDAIQFCKNVPPGQGGVISCLRKNSDKISAKCKKVLPQE